MSHAAKFIERGNNTEKLPPAGQTVFVQCEGFRCLAFRGRDGKWRDAFQKTELKGTIQILNSD